MSPVTVEQRLAVLGVRRLVTRVLRQGAAGWLGAQGKLNRAAARAAEGCLPRGMAGSPKEGMGMPVDVTGVSGPLPFNGKGDITTANIQIWCVPPSTPPDPDVGGVGVDSGFYFDSANGKMAGAFSASCVLPSYSATGCP